MFKTTKALVLRNVRYKEADRILTVLSETDGKMTVKARGALRKGSKTAAATQLLCWSDMVLFQNKGKYTVNEASTIEEFAGLRADISSLALASYFAECLEALSQEDIPDAQLLQLGLNSIYAIANNLYDPLLVKAAFELRLMKISGYEPELSECPACGNDNPLHPAFSVSEGIICCREHRSPETGSTMLITPHILSAMRYFCCADPKKLFSFPIEGEDLDRLSYVCERYLSERTERRFGSLDYWKKVK